MDLTFEDVNVDQFQQMKRERIEAMRKPQGEYRVPTGEVFGTDGSSSSC